MLKYYAAVVAAALLFTGCGSSDCCGSKESQSSSVDVKGEAVKIAPTAVISAQNSSCTEGQTIRFDGRSSSDPDGLVKTYTWFLDGKAVAHTSVPSFSCEIPGEKEVCLQVIDDDNLTSAKTCQRFVVLKKEVVKLPPVAKIEAPKFCTIGETIRVDGTKSSDSDGEVVAYSWSFEDEKSSFDKPYFVCAKEGNQTLCLDVIDNDGLMDRNCTTIVGQQVPNKPPVAKIALAKKQCTVGETLIADASQSSDEDGFVTHFNWTPQSQDIARTTFSCNTPGEHQICLSVVDNKGLQSERVCETITVQKPANKPPVAKVTLLPEECRVGETALADGTQSSDSDGNVTAYLWQLDQNMSYSTEAKPVITCDKEGTKHICLKVTDNEGAESQNEACADLTVKPAPIQLIPPVAKITVTKNTGDSVESFTADCQGSYDPDTVDSDNNPQNDGKVVDAKFTVYKVFEDGTKEDPHTGVCPKWISIPDTMQCIAVSLTVKDDDAQETTVTKYYDKALNEIDACEP